jgi:predicted secreted hydrolase
VKRSLLLAALGAASCAAPGPFWAFDPDLEEGVHADVQVEWWYHWGFLSDADGGEWSVFSSFFRTRKPGGPLMRYQLYDLTDLRTGARSSRSAAGEESLALVAALTGRRELPRPHLVIPGTPLEQPGEPLRLRYGDDLLERVGDRVYVLRVQDVDVTLRSVAPAMAIEGTGLTGLDDPSDMHYYTLPRLEARGSVRGRAATGVFWYDHQWGRSWIGPEIGWAWWGLHLDDGRNLNAYVLRDVRSGTVRRAVATLDGAVHALSAEPLEHWTSSTQVRYPVRWRLRAGPLDLEIRPCFEDRELPVLGEQESIWEGPVKATGTAAGRGFQELVGYARERRANAAK